MDPKTAVRLFAVLVCFIYQTMAQSCGGSSYVEPGRVYYIYSPNYANSYGQGMSCSWIMSCPQNYNCVMECNIELPQSTNCVVDRLLISRSGDPNYIGANVYCGITTVTLTSVSNRMSAALLTSQNSPGGRFLCTLTAKPATPTCSCGWRKSTRIVGGVEAGRNEYPNFAAIKYIGINEIKCAGTIIEKRYVLTAAHCLDRKQINEFLVIAGAHNIKISEPTTQVFGCEWFKKHELFNSNSLLNDIAIIRVNKDIIYNDVVGPVCLPFKYMDASFAEKEVEAMGLGTLFFGGPKPDTLQKVILGVISNSNCQQKIGTGVASSQMCTFRQGKDSCQDDSGGPLLYVEPQTGLYYAVGLISFGGACGSLSPSVNTRLTSFIPWIVANTPGANICVKN